MPLVISLGPALIAGCMAGAPSGLTRAPVQTPVPSGFVAREWRTVPAKPKEFPPRPYSLAFSRDSRLLAIAYVDDFVRLYDCAAGSELPPPGEANSYNDHAAFSPDGTLLAVGGGEAEVRAWDLQTGRKVIDIDEGEPWVMTSGFAFSPDGRSLATATMRFRLLTLLFGPRGEVNVRDLATGRRVFQYVAHEGPVESVAFSPDGKRLAFGSSARMSVHGLLLVAPCCKLRVVDLDSGKVRFTAGLSHWVDSVAFSPDGRRVAAADGRGGVGLWDAATGKLAMVLRRPSDNLTGATVAFSPDGKWVAASVGDRAYIWDAQTGAEQLHAMPDDAGAAVAFSPDGQLLATGDRKGQVKVWRVADRSTISEESPTPRQ